MAKVQNLALYSSDFTQVTWSKDNLTIGSNTVDTLDPFGGNLADEFIENSVNGLHRVYQTINFTDSSVYTTSYYVKAGTRTWTYIASNGGALTAYFDLTNGVVGNVGVGTIAKIDNAGNGWWRCSVSSLTGISGTQTLIYPALANGVVSYQGINGNKALYVFGFQVVQANWAGPYAPTGATAINTGPIRSIVPKTQNLLTYSEDFTNAAWSKDNLTTGGNSTDTLDPFGSNLADELIENAVNGLHGIYQAITPVGNSGNTASCYMKAGTRTWSYVVAAWTGGSMTAYFDLANGVIGNVGTGTVANIQNIGNGWYRCSISLPNNPAVSQILLYPAAANGVVSYQGVNGYKAIYIYGAQVVQANWSGPYQQTTTSAINLGPIRSIVPKTQNLLTYSEDFSNWTSLGGGVAAPVVTVNQEIAPDGTLTADKIDLPAVTGAGNYSVTFTVGATNPQNTNTTFSIWLKGVAGGEVIYMNVPGFTKTTTCTLTTSWQRFSVVSYPNNAGGAIEIGVDLRNGANTAKSAQSYYAWGAQTVQANWEGPYQKTVATAVNNGPIRSIVPKTQNLFTYSEDFTNAAWVTTGTTTVTPNTTVAPDGTTTADTLTTAATSVYCQQTWTSYLDYGLIYQSFSVYAKYVDTPWQNIFIGDGSGSNYVHAWFNVQTGVKGTIAKVGSGFDIFDYTITPAANGFYRLGIVVTKSRTSNTTSGIRACTNADNDSASTVGKNVIVWGAQLIAKTNWIGPYQKTVASAVNTGQIRSIVPKVQNLLTYSEQLDNGAWVTSNATVTPNAIIDPTGALTADSVNETVSNTEHFIEQVLGAAISGVYTGSIYLKQGTLPTANMTIVHVGVGTATSELNYTFASNTYTIAGTLSPGYIQILDVGNGWKKVIFTFNLPTGCTSLRMRLYPKIQGAYVGDPGNYSYFWGAQLIRANWAGPYTPTTGTAVNTGPIRNIA